MRNQENSNGSDKKKIIESVKSAWQDKRTRVYIILLIVLVVVTVIQFFL